MMTMHRDVKLGLALAVLLIGSTTAFFYRNGVEVGDGLPKLQNPERLDAAIAHRSAAPYLGPPEPFDLSNGGAEVDSIWTKPAFLGGATPAAFHRTSLTPDPIRIILDESDELLDESPPVTVGPMLVSPAASDTGERHYIVQPGDTLTGIAVRLLGSTGRYRELYEWNRDRLAGPDDLRVGMTLRIPSADAIVPRQPLPHPDASMLDNENVAATDRFSADEPPPKDESNAAPADAGIESAEPARLFEPVRNPPFVPQRFRNSTRHRETTQSSEGSPAT